MNSLDFEIYRLNRAESLLIQYLRTLPAQQQALLLDLAWRLTTSRPIPNNVVALKTRK